MEVIYYYIENGIINMSAEPETQQGRKRKAPALEEEEPRLLDWRLDPEESLSDWKIDILVEGGKTTHATYHVHRPLLSVGAERSEYFSRLFANQGHKEHDTHTGCIEMEELAANAFPLMLDYLYSLWNTHENPITTENVVALHYLGRYFGIRGLRKEAQSFWKKHMTICQLGIYLNHATLFQDDQVYDAVVEKCVGSIDSITVDSRLAELPGVQFWLDVLGKNQGRSSLALSTLVSSFCVKNKEVLDVETFLQLTENSVLPELSTAAAMEFFQLEKAFVPVPATSNELSDLQRRGLEALISHRKSDPLVAHAELRGRFNELPPLVLEQMLERSMGALWDCNQKLQDCNYKQQEAIMKTCVPREIVVSDAGIDEVNGTYYRASTFREFSPRFTMDGNWNGIPAKFELHVAVVSDDGGDAEHQWHFSILSGTKPSALDRDFYVAVGSNDSSRLPPQCGWWVCVDGNWRAAAWPPLLSFHFDKLPSDRQWYL